MSVTAWLTAAQAGERWGISTQTFANWRSLGKGPKFVKLPSGQIRYNADELERWMLAGEAAA